MYLAKLHNSSSTRYEIRESYKRDDDTFGHRLIFDLGEKPEQYFELYEDHIILFNPELLELITEKTGKNAEKNLEHLLWNFFPAVCRERLGHFKQRTQLKFGPLTRAEKADISKEIHIFDRRRLYYLRYGAVDQSRLSRLHEKCCRPLLGQSRDEREFYFREEERVLEPGKYLQYVYAIFNLQKYFTQSFAPWLPEALAKEEMAEYFINAICRLQNDNHFWQRAPESRFLHDHLVRYLIMFFDFNAAPRSFFDEHARSFMAGHRSFRWPERRASATPEKISSIFGTPYNDLKKMSKSTLNKLYRKKAMEFHPDKGGDHDRFIELSDVYNELLRVKNK